MKVSVMTAIAAGFMFMAPTASQAATALDGIIQILEQQGFSEVEVSREGGRVTILAKDGERVRTLIYDVRSGALIADVTNKPGKAVAPGANRTAKANNSNAGGNGRGRGGGSGGGRGGGNGGGGGGGNGRK